MTQEEFLEALRNNDADDWVIVMGNEAGDLDSLVSALTLSYLYNHLETPQKAVALLQTEQGACSLWLPRLLAKRTSTLSGWLGYRRSRLATGECARTALRAHEFRTSRSPEYVSAVLYICKLPATADLLRPQPLTNFRSR